MILLSQCGSRIIEEGSRADFELQFHFISSGWDDRIQDAGVGRGNCWFIICGVC